MPLATCRGIKRVLQLAPILVVAVTAVPGGAANFDLSAHAGDTYTDNAAFTDVARRSDNVVGVWTKMSMETQGPRLDSRITANLTYLHFVNGTFGDQFPRGFVGDARLKFLEGRLVWVTTENYGPVLEDPLSTERADNWAYDSYFTTGPDVIVGSGSGTHMVLGARYGRVDYEAKDVPGNQQYSGSFSLVLPGAPRFEKSLNFNARRVSQESGTLAQSSFRDDYETREAYARVSNKTERSSLYLDAGLSMLKAGGVVSNTPLVRLGLGRKISSRITLAVSAGTQYQENLGRFQRLQGAPQPGAGGVADPRNDVVNSGSPMKERYASLVLSFDGQRTILDISGAYNRVELEHSTEALAKQEYVSAMIDLERRVTPIWSLDLAANYDQRSFVGVDRKDDDMFASLRSVWRLQPKLDLSIGYLRQQRSSNVSGADYQVNSVRLEIVYRPYSEIGARARRNRR